MTSQFIIIDLIKFHNAEPELPDKSCRDNEFSCHDNSTCLVKSQQCDGRQDCTDGSDETNCPNLQLDCAPLSHLPPDKTSTISCSNSTTCIYSCVNTTWRFPLEESGGVVLVSEMEITCDVGTSQWSHVTARNPLGHLPSCRGGKFRYLDYNVSFLSDLQRWGKGHIFKL